MWGIEGGGIPSMHPHVPAPPPPSPLQCQAPIGHPTLPLAPSLRQVDRTVLVDTARQLRDLLYRGQVQRINDPSGFIGLRQGNSIMIREFNGG